MLEADEEKVNLELTGWELEELYQALMLKREASRAVSDIDDYRLLERIESLLDAEDKEYCKEKAKQYSRCLAQIFIEYGRLEQFQYDHDWAPGNGRRAPQFLTDSISATIRSAYEQRLTVEIEYEARKTQAEESPVTVRQVDIYRLSRGYLEAYCHIRRGVRVFRTDRILDARLTITPYEIPEGFVPTV